MLRRSVFVKIGVNVDRFCEQGDEDGGMFEEIDGSKARTDF